MAGLARLNKDGGTYRGLDRLDKDGHWLIRRVQSENWGFSATTAMMASPRR
jgi:hypothetical protein